MAKLSDRMDAEEELIAAIEKSIKFKLIPGTYSFKFREKMLKEAKKYRENQNKIKSTS